MAEKVQASERDRSYTLEDRRQDAADAFRAARRYHEEVRDIYKFFMPFREPTSERANENGTSSEGAKRTQALFDGTGPAAAFSYAAQMQADWLPMFEEIFALEAGPLWPASDDEQRKQRNADLQAISTIVHSLIDDVRLSANEMFSDLFAGTGAILMTKGDRDRNPIDACAVPITELALQNGATGKLDRWFWKKNYKCRHLPEKWPDAKYSNDLNEHIKQNRNEDIEVTQYTYWNHKTKRFELCAWTSKGDTLLAEEVHRTTPWITPRGIVVPGEAHGRGLAHLGLPFVKTANEARKLALRAAAFALLGIWVRRHDGVFNPDTAVMAPGAMWKVASTGSAGIGPSIQRLDIPHNFDVSSIVIKDEREQIRRVLLDDELPELADRVRSPTEIAGRMRRYDRNRGGSTVRLAIELVTPIARRGVDLCEQHGFLPGSTSIDNILTRCAVKAPAAAAQRSAKVERVVSYLQIVTGLLGPQAVMLAAEIESLVPELGRWMGVEEKWLRNKGSVKELKALVATIVAQQQAQEAQAKQPNGGAPELKPAMQLAGGMM